MTRLIPIKRVLFALIVISSSGAGSSLLLAQCDLHHEPSCCHHSSCEPFLRFFDDLAAFPHGTCERDPYEERIETERHDFTQSTRTVGRGVAQLEMGYTYYYRDHHNEIEHSHATPETLLRIGLSDDIEFRVRWNYAWRFGEEEHLDGAQDMIWSFKLGVTEECGLIPESALEIRSSVPTGGSSWTLGRVEAGWDYIYSWSLAENWKLYGSTGYSPGALGEFSLTPEEAESDHFRVWSQSVATSTELTENSTMYLEWFGLYSENLADEFVISVFNIGFDYYVTDDFVLDLRVGMGLTDDTDDFFTGIGGGYRY